MDKVKTEIYLALGSNLGDRLALLRLAITTLSSFVTITARSPVYETAPAYVSDQPAFLNAVITGETDLQPVPLLAALKTAESECGRVPGLRYGPRAIDIDILFYGTQIISEPHLTIPHPLIAEREFVLRPLCDIAPDFIHPQTGLSIKTMLAAIPHDAAMAKLGDLL